MKITITPTEEFLAIDTGPGGNLVPVRVWDGRTERGASCRILVAGVQVPEGAGVDFSEFDEALTFVPVDEPREQG